MSIFYKIAGKKMNIRDWLWGEFFDDRPKIFVEIGANDGRDTQWMSDIPGVTVHAFEPDPRLSPGTKPNVFWRQVAIGNQTGMTTFYPSAVYDDAPWTESGSIHQPTGHLQRYPGVKFGEPFQVSITTLDIYCHDAGIEKIDFIWADMHGAERDMILGGQKVLPNTRFLYTEYSKNPLYQGQVDLHTLIGMLPGSWRIVELWPDDVLLENVSFID
jgi:FkbM family methyltransferase